MKNEIEFPETLAAAIKYFADADTALNFMVSIRWPDGKPVCPCCQKSNAGFLATRKIWKCRDCGKQFSEPKASPQPTNRNCIARVLQVQAGVGACRNEARSIAG